MFTSKRSYPYTNMYTHMSYTHKRVNEFKSQKTNTFGTIYSIWIHFQRDEGELGNSVKIRTLLVFDLHPVENHIQAEWIAKLIFECIYLFCTIIGRIQMIVLLITHSELVYGFKSAISIFFLKFAKFGIGQVKRIMFAGPSDVLKCNKLWSLFSTYIVSITKEVYI